MVPQKCAHGVALFFWKRKRLICTIAILRGAKHGDFSPSELKLLRQLYPQFLAALRRIESLERERSVSVNFQQFLGRLPLPTMILRWNLKPIYQNPAAREFCAVWEKGTGGSETNKSEFPGSRRGRGSMPCSQARMGGCATTSALRATNRIHRRTSAASALA